MTLVVDASLAAKWILREEGTAEAWRFLDRYGRDLHAPDLFHTEVLGALVRLANERKITRDAALQRMAWWTTIWAEGAIITHRVTPALAAEAARLAIVLGHPLKDCVYLALADALGVPLATCDVKFHDRVGDPARVRMLADLV